MRIREFLKYVNPYNCSPNNFFDSSGPVCPLGQAAVLNGFDYKSSPYPNVDVRYFLDKLVNWRVVEKFTRSYDECYNFWLFFWLPKTWAFSWALSKAEKLEIKLLLEKRIV